MLFKNETIARDFKVKMRRRRGSILKRKIIIIVNRKRAINLYLNEHVHLARDLGKFKT